ncbi:serine hydrolase [Synechococcus sp. CBW1002]|uniref:serine hydrolase n=1 Tax=Synechococcus sp. CBW1002 TaxID=1353134 RepID=UPI0018CD5E48|nr:serine hydrolase [Synechococcus sp. CBW1002]QPN61210.1 serine hydrolase [Synechococcus sp. CBW1002]
MVFYNPDPGMAERLADLVAALELEGREGLGQRLSITWLRYPESLRHQAHDLDPTSFWQRPLTGAAWAGDRLRYPASVVKLIYLVAAEAWLQRQLIGDGPELRRALADMIRDSSNDATALVMDLLSGTTSGPELPPHRYSSWCHQRGIVNRWLTELAWPELEGCNACQKTWGDGPYGRERQFYGPDLQNRNRLSTDAVARVLHGVMAGAMVSPPACRRMQDLLARSLDPLERQADPENQVDGFIGEVLPLQTPFWSKAGWMSQARHDAAYAEPENGLPFLLVIFSEGQACADDPALLPAITTELLRYSRPV